MTSSSRLFFALWPDETTRLKLIQLNKSFQNQNINPIPPFNYHVTLVFLGNVTATVECAIKEQATNITATPFEVVFNHLERWEKPKVLCLTNLQPPQALIDLSLTLNNAANSCGIETDSRPYRPHITLARHVHKFTDQACHPIHWQADSFCLVESCSEKEGVVYKVKQRWPFQPHNF